jgi:hypothetical protein
MSNQQGQVTISTEEIQKSLNNIYAGLNAANKAGVFTIPESAALHQDFERVKVLLVILNNAIANGQNKQSQQNVKNLNTSHNKDNAQVTPQVKTEMNNHEEQVNDDNDENDDVEEEDVLPTVAEEDDLSTDSDDSSDFSDDSSERGRVARVIKRKN